jgi:hypothetical protein
MDATNEIIIDEVCPVCRQSTTIRCQTHVAANDEFAERVYRIGERMAWWPEGDPRHAEWNENCAGPDGASEACYGTCAACAADLFVVIAFDALAPTQVLAVGPEEEWPEGYLR